MDSEWTHLQLRIEQHLPLVLGTPLQEHANSHVHECTRHLCHSLLLVERLFQESTLEMAVREQNRRQNPNCRGEHPRSQVIPAIPSTPASPCRSDMSEDDETLSWPIFEILGLLHNPTRMRRYVDRRTKECHLRPSKYSSARSVFDNKLHYLVLDGSYDHPAVRDH